MKKAILIAASTAAMAFVAPQAFAQAKNFEGFSAVLSANSASTNTNMKFIAGGDYSGSGPGTYASVQAQYAFALTDKVVLGVGATAALNSYSLGSIFTTINLEGTQKQQMSVDLMPGYAVSETALVFGRVSYIDSKSSSAGVLGTTEKDTSGIGYGLGLRMMANKNLFWQVEYGSNVYNDVTTAFATTKMTSSVLSLGVGYKF